MRRIFGLCLALALALGSTVVADAQESQTIVDVEADDAEMNAAKARAVATLPDFYRRLAAPGPGESGFMLKFDILPGDGAEFVWAVDLQRADGTMTGVLINQPVHTQDKLGERVSIVEADIIDWAYFQGTVMQGAFTNRVVLDRMPPDEAASLRRAYGW